MYFLCPCIRVHSLCSIEFPTHVICRTGGIRTTERGSPFLKPCCITKGSCNLSTENSNLSTQEKLSSPSRNFYMFVDRGLVNLIYITVAFFFQFKEVGIKLQCNRRVLTLYNFAIVSPKLKQKTQGFGHDKNLICRIWVEKTSLF